MEYQKIIAVVPLPEGRLLVCLLDGTIYLWHYRLLPWDGSAPHPLSEDQMFQQVAIEAGGRGISWPCRLRCSVDDLLRDSSLLPLDRNDFLRFCQYSILSTGESAKLLRCTRQNIDSLVRRGKLTPVKTYARNKLFLRSDVARRLWTHD
ncbi:MAG: DUF2442 domain-containing protein [Clostridiales bacterium]|nr:DUF2442 domain-containing protein [Clostridiales bacterium]